MLFVARRRLRVPLFAVVVSALVAASMVVVAVATPAWSQWSAGPSAADTPVVVRDGTWYLRTSNTSGHANLAFRYGDPRDIPVMGDWNGDGVDTPGVVRGSTWYLRNSNSGGHAEIAFGYGNAGDRPVVGDWNGDGVDTPGVVRGATWYLRNSPSGGHADIVLAYGNAGDRPVVGDWNADGVDTPGVVRGSTWYLSNSNSGGHAHIAFTYGNAGDRPVVGDWNADGVDTPGVVRGSTWYLSNSNSGGHAHIAFAYGNAGDRLLGESPNLHLPTLRPGDRGPVVAQLQHRLEALGFWVGAKDGVYGSLTEQAVFAVQKYHRMPATGVADHATRQRIDRGPRVQAASGHGDVIEVDKYRQLIFVVRGGHTLWAFNTSTGNEQPYSSGGRWYSAVTPTGRFQIFRQIDGWRQSHLGRLYRPKYFTTSGIAIHGSTSVPPFPASHGCVRLTLAAMDYVWGANLAPIGTQVLVYGSLP